MMILFSVCISAFAFVRSVIDIMATRRLKAKKRFEAELKAQIASVVAEKQDQYAQLRMARRAKFAQAA